MPGEAIKKGSIQMKKSFFLIRAKLCPLKSVDFKQFYNSVVWKKKKSLPIRAQGLLM